MRIPIVPILALLAATRLHAQCPGNGDQLYREHRLDEARVVAQGALARNADDAAAHFCLGKVALAANDVDRAIEELERAVKLDDGRSAYHLWLGNAVGTAAQRASRFRQPFLARRVKSEFERAVQLDPRSVDARIGLVQYYSIAPAIVGGSMDRAREQVAEIVKIDPMRGHVEGGALAEHEKDYAAAEREYAAAVAAAPDSAWAFYALGSFYQRRQDWANAFATYDRLIAAHPGEINAHLGWARTAALSGENLERGEREVRLWLATPPKDATPATHAAVHYRLGTILEKQGRKEQARAEYDQALKLDPKNEAAKKALKGG